MENQKKNTLVESTEPKIMNINISRTILGLTEIGNLEIEDFTMNYNITRSIANLSVAEKAYGKTIQTLQKKHIQKDEKGNYATLNGFYIFLSENDKEAYQKAFDELNETIVDVKIYSMKASDLQKIKGIKGTTMAKCFELIIDDLKK